MADNPVLYTEIYGVPEQVRDIIEDLDFPVNKEEIIQTAEMEGVDTEIIALFEELPDDMYEAPLDVYEALEID